MSHGHALGRATFWMLKLVNFHRCPWYLNQRPYRLRRSTIGTCYGGVALQWRRLCGCVHEGAMARPRTGNGQFCSAMSIVSFIIKHIHFSDRNVMLRSVSDRIEGGSPGVCVWEIGQVLPGLCFFSSETHLSYRRGRGRIGWMFQCSCWSASS